MESENRPLQDSFAVRRMKLSRNKNQSKKKDQWIKPWSAKERLFVIIVFVGTIALSGLFAASSREWKLPGMTRLNLDMYRSKLTGLFKSEPVVIQGDTRGIMAHGEQTVADFKDITKELSGIYGLSVIDLKSGYNFGVYQSETFTAASLIKLPVMIMLYQLAEDGKLDLEKKYVLKTEDKLGGSGSLFSKPAGYEITYRNLLRLMAQQSDNTAFNVGRKMLGDSAINLFCRKLGMEVTKVETNVTSPRDIAVFFQELWNGNLINNQHRSEMLTNLTATSYENWLTSGIPSQIQVAHKYGREIHTVNDAGIVFTEDPYVVVILTKGVVEGQADEVFPQLSRMVYTNLTSVQ